MELKFENFNKNFPNTKLVIYVDTNQIKNDFLLNLEGRLNDLFKNHIPSKIDLYNFVICMIDNSDD